ncbi:MAG: hypothetical protein Q4D62_04760 [Planctomycetia bacterium]|nr:hypothetical protein [Planctomycetia bacterium]
MDKLKVVWRYTRKYGFWVVSLICLLLVSFIWRQVAGSLLSDFDTRKSAIEGEFSNMQSLASAQDQPNAQVVEFKRNALRTQSENVLQSWEQLYNAQKANNIWPISDQRYKRAFEEAADRKRETPGYELSDSAKEYYWQYIRRYLRKIKETYDIKRPNKEYLESNATLAGNTGMRPGNTGTMEGGLRDDQMDGIVYWDDVDFKRLEDRLTWRTRPSTQRILVAQEDLWVYEALLRIIKETNAGKSAFNASVKEIYALEIAQDTTEAFEKAAGRILKVGEKKSEDDGMSMSGSSMQEGMEEEEVSEDPEFDELFAERYVNSFGKPLSATELKEAPPFAEFKMMPVRMHLMINQRAISQLLVNCINSSMPVEVLQISINPERGKILDVSDLTSSSMGEGGPGTSRSRRESRRSSRNQEMMGVQDDGGFYSDGMTSGRPGTRDGMSGGRNVSNRGPEDVDLEVLGMIYIFNPPDETQFPILQETEEGMDESGEESSEATGEASVSEMTEESSESEAPTQDTTSEEAVPEPEEAVSEPEEAMTEEEGEEAPEEELPEEELPEEEVEEETSEEEN